MYTQTKAAGCEHTTAADETHSACQHSTPYPALVELPPCMARDYLAQCHRWRQAAQHVPIARRLMESA